ncbi:TPA: hypothetical protein ACHVI3_000839 [Streptococcus suis]
MKKFDAFLKAVVKSDYGMSIRDVMETDYGHLMAILQAEEAESEKESDKVVDLSDFIGSLS